MNKPPAFQFYPEKFLIGTSHFSAEEVGAYIRLLCHQWDKGFIEKDEKILKKISGISVKKLQKVLKKFVEVSEKKLQNEVLEQIRVKQQEWRKKSSEAGKASAESKKREAEILNQGSTKAQPIGQPNANSLSLTIPISPSLESNDSLKIADKPPPIKNLANPKKKILEEKKDVPPPPKVSTMHTTCKQFFEAEAKRLEKIVSWSGRHGKSLNELIAKIKNSYKAFSGNDPTDDQIIDSFKMFITKLPEWQKQNGYDINSINAGFDRLANEIKSANGKAGTEKSHDDIRAMFRGKK